MSDNYREKNSEKHRQSAIDHLIIRGNSEIGNVSQVSQTIIQKKQNANYNCIDEIKDRYNKNVAKLERKYNSSKQFNEILFIKELEDFRKKLKQDAEDYAIQAEQMESLSESRLICVRKSEELKADISKIERLLDPLEYVKNQAIERFISVFLQEDNPTESSWESSLLKLSFETRQSIRNLNSYYETKQRDLENELIQKIEDCKKERNVGIYKCLLREKLIQDDYPLHSDSRLELDGILQDFDNLDQTTIENAEKEVIKPFYQNNLQRYIEEYKQKLTQEGYPLASDSITELNAFKKSLGLEELVFSDLLIRAIEQEVIKPFYQKKLQKYKKEYAFKFEQQGHPLNSESIKELKSLKKNWGLKKLFFPDLDITAIEKEIVEPFYRVNLERYEQEYIQQLQQEGYPLSSNSNNKLQLSIKNLGLEHTFFAELDLENEFSTELDLNEIEKRLIKPFYQENLKNYAQEYSQKIKQSMSSLKSNLLKEMNLFSNSLRLRNEDVKIVEELIKNHIAIDRLVCSESEVDYWKLREFLINGEWKKADEQTTMIMLKIAGREKVGNVDKESLENFPDIDLFTIDKLWVEYSYGSFGFSVQKKIFDSVNQNKGKFAEKVGWRGEAGLFRGAFAWKSDDDLTFSQDAPDGHLPAWGVKDKKLLGNDFSFIFLKFSGLVSDSPEALKASQERHYEQELLKEYEQEGYPLSSDARINLDHIQVSLELLDEQNFREIENRIEKPFYYKNLQCYGQDFSQKIEQEGYFVSCKNSTDLKSFQQSLDIRDEDIFIIEELIKKYRSISRLISSEFETAYWKLRKFLVEGKWQKADEQTKMIILKVAGRVKVGNLDKDSIENFPEIDLFILDRFWVEYSKGHFGFSVQNTIFHSVNQDKDQFAEKIGWRSRAGLFRGAFAWKSYSNLIFSLDAPKGHLPAWGVQDRKLLEDNFIHFLDNTISQN
jgi:hypothetical protein